MNRITSATDARPTKGNTMFTHHRTSWRRTVAAAGVAAVALLGGLAAAQSASAENIDTGATGSIIIHKYEHQTTTSATQNPQGTGDSIGTNPLAGVVFSAYPITSIDLSTPAGWTAVDAIGLTSACVAPGHTLGTAVTSPATNASGQATIGGLTVRAYLVCETSAPANVVDRAQPFIVTIPYPFNGTWLYNVNVYPKNGTAGIVKSVNPQTSLGLGSTATFPVTTSVPALADNATFTYYAVKDSFAASLTSPAVTSVTIDGVAVNSSYYAIQTSGSTLSVVFTNAGLNWLTGQQGKSVVTTFTGTVSAIGATANTASYKITTGTTPPPNNTDTPTPPSDGDVPPVPSAPVTINWGDIKVTKVDSATPAKGLSGATFEVYAADNPYATDCSTVTATGSAISVSGSTVFTSTGTNGALVVPGLFVSDSVNATVNAAQRCYVLKEIGAPAGYVTPSGPSAYTPLAVTIGATTAAGGDGTITNTQHQGWNLPLTGGAGTVWLILLGTGLVLIAGGAALVNHRRKNRPAAR